MLCWYDLGCRVNLGGLFVLEPFITPSLFQAYPGSVDEWTLSTQIALANANGSNPQNLTQVSVSFPFSLSVDLTCIIMTKKSTCCIIGHGESLLDVHHRAGYCPNCLRWAQLDPYAHSLLGNRDVGRCWAGYAWRACRCRALLGEGLLDVSTSFPCRDWNVYWCMGVVRYILKVLQWARKYGLRVELDLHTVPGSQNGEFFTLYFSFLSPFLLLFFGPRPGKTKMMRITKFRLSCEWRDNE